MSGKTSRSSAGPAEGPADFTKKKEEEKAVRKNEEAKEYIRNIIEEEKQ